MIHIYPELRKTSFHCPHCNVVSEQTWSGVIGCQYNAVNPNGTHSVATFGLPFWVAKCRHCNNFSIWQQDNRMIFPLAGNTEPVNEDMPDLVKVDYKEAQDIFNISPKGSAALLRLAIQKLCIHLGEKGDNLNNDIANLVTKGLPVYVQQALDSVRVIGNNAVHPGLIDLNDNKEIVIKLFRFVNVICDVLISQPKLIAELYDREIPENVKSSIDKRDNKTTLPAI